MGRRVCACGSELCGDQRCSADGRELRAAEILGRFGGDTVEMITVDIVGMMVMMGEGRRRRRRRGR